MFQMTESEERLYRIWMERYPIHDWQSTPQEITSLYSRLQRWYRRGCEEQLVDRALPSVTIKRQVVTDDRLIDEWQAILAWLSHEYPFETDQVQIKRVEI